VTLIEPAFRVASLVLPAAVLLACGNGGTSQIHDAASLPSHISVCGRTWAKDDLGRTPRLAEIRSQTGVEPVVVDPGFLPQCPVGPCTTVAADDPCDTVIYVRVGDDAYIDYSLSGGP
jgi:hypothetical protein